MENPPENGARVVRQIKGDCYGIDYDELGDNRKR